MKTGIPMSGSTVKNHISLKTRFGFHATRRTSFLSWFQACQRVLPPVLIPMKQESHSSSSSSSSSPTVISPVPVSKLVDDRTVEPVETQANEIPKTNKKETTIERGNPLCSDDPEIPGWLQEFKGKFGG